MKIGSLFSGYGGLDMGVQAVLGGELAWHVEYDKAPSQILAHHWPAVPNYGDVTTLDWASVPAVDVLTAGYPCQPFSVAGKRKGSTDERHLWPYVLEAIRYLRPRVVVLENVRGHLTLGFDRVLLDLAEAGYDADWICLPASDAGAPHKRERLFIVASPRDASCHGGRLSGESRGEGQTERGGVQEAWSTLRRDSGSAARPTPYPAHIGCERGRSARDGWARSSNGSDTATDPNDPARDGEWSRAEFGEGSASDWGKYESAIRQWEPIVGRAAPAATVPDGRGGNYRLNPAFVEWMMGLPAGHVTDMELTRAEQLKALGNGVVPQQAALALSILLGTTSHSARIEGEGS